VDAFIAYFTKSFQKLRKNIFPKSAKGPLLAINKILNFLCFLLFVDFLRTGSTIWDVDRSIRKLFSSWTR